MNDQTSAAPIVAQPDHEQTCTALATLRAQLEDLLASPLTPATCRHDLDNALVFVRRAAGTNYVAWANAYAHCACACHAGHWLCDCCEQAAVWANDEDDDAVPEADTPIGYTLTPRALAVLGPVAPELDPVRDTDLLDHLNTAYQGFRALERFYPEKEEEPMGLLARIAAQEGEPMEPLYHGIDLLGPAIVARAEAFAATLPPAHRAELGALLCAVDTASEARTGRVADAVSASVLARVGLPAPRWWAAVEALDPPIRLPA